MIEKDKQYIWHPFTQAFNAVDPLPIVRAEGIWLYEEGEKKYMDVNSSWWTINHGHGNPYLIKKISEQFSKIDHVIFAGVTHPIAVEAAERVVNYLPEQFSKVFFSDNGSTSVEVGLKMIYQYWYNKGESKKRFLAIEGAYHGDTFGAMSVGQRGFFNEPFEHLFFDVDFIPFPTDDNWQDVINQTRALFETKEFAGFIFEPLIQGAAGMRIYKAEWLDALIALAKEFDVLTIADEVMTGFYRTGTMFAINQIQQEPDIICLSKGITGGILPIGFTVATEAIFDAFLSEQTSKALLHGHSFTGNPMACAAICASLDLFEQGDSLKGVEMLTKSHLKFIEKYKDHPKIKDVKSIGTILSIEVEIGAETTYFAGIRQEAFAFFLENDLFLRPLGNIIFINPPYCITAEELEYTYDKIIEFLTERVR
ncbi:adenosylmethionine--8-amino-7-oxononanoate transaminase [Crocinitomix catalasitica]|uniref:adenosylmethionine--8-amino-7-oxononanoate transaminase n=1 Tax=Crocinitomix catalasitica TaxID=184607 RepID=UPI000AFCA016|nr:adenosylmethionine--8-amino-7-oxononanoate transaminase [Crocinitomix catalasitica]